MSRQDDTAPSPGSGGIGSVLHLAEAAVPILLILALLLHPTQITVRQWALAVANVLGSGRALAERVPSLHVTISDALVLLSFLVWLFLRWRGGLLPRCLRRYPVALAALIACALVSLVPFLKPSSAGAGGATVDYARGGKELVQLFLLFGCAYLVLVDYLGSERWRKWLILAFFTAASVALLAGLSEYLQLRAPSPEARRAGAIITAVRVDATFGFQGEPAGAGESIGTSSNRCVLGAWLTLVLPLLWAAFLFGPRLLWRVVALVLVLVGGLLLLHGGLWAAALVALLALSFVRSRFSFLATAAGMLVFYALVFSFGPQQHGQILLDSVMLRRSTDRFRTLPLYEGGEQLGGPAEAVGLERRPYSPWEQKYVEWQPALLALARNPLFGLGLGNYQRSINAFYSDQRWNVYDMPKSSENLMEPGGNAFYAVWLAETGFVGLLAFVWLVLTFMRLGAAGSRMEPDAAIRGLKRGACAALGAATLGCLFTNYWVRGVGIAFVFVLALASAPSPGRQGEREGAEDAARPENLPPENGRAIIP